MDRLKILSEKEFYNFIFNDYPPSKYEEAELKDTRFIEGTCYPHLSKTRSFLVYREIAKGLPNTKNILDVGPFPGTFIRELKHLLGEYVNCSCVGQKADEEFQRFMKPYADKCVNAELDPFYQKSNAEIKMPFEDEKFDIVVATEILEHLISPLELISEGSRVLRKGGKFIITTPNVSHIGAVFKILTGRSNHERLKRSPMYLQNDPWRGHIRFYDKEELTTLFLNSGLEMTEHKYYLEKGWDRAKESLLKKASLRIVDKVLPIYNQSHFAVFTKK